MKFKFGKYEVETDEEDGRSYTEMKQAAFRAAAAVNDAKSDIKASWDNGLVGQYGDIRSGLRSAIGNVEPERVKLESEMMEGDIDADTRHADYTKKYPHEVLESIYRNYRDGIDALKTYAIKEHNNAILDDIKRLDADLEKIKTNWFIKDSPMDDPHKKYSIAYEKGASAAPYAPAPFISAVYKISYAKDRGDTDLYNDLLKIITTAVDNISGEIDDYIARGPKYLASRGLDGNDGKAFIEGKYSPYVYSLKVNGLEDLSNKLHDKVEELAATWSTPKINYEKVYFGR
jgi:hypothetical protein